MSFDLTPVRPLAKIWTLISIVNTVVQWLKKETQGELDPEFVKTLANMVIMDTAEFLSGAGSGDYGKDVTIADQASSMSILIITGAVYTDANKTINKTAHGYTVADIGKRIVYYNASGIDSVTPPPRVVIAELVSVTDVDNFVVSIAAGTDIGTCHYVLFSAYSSVNVDISDYRIANIVKIKDSVNGEIRKAGDIQFDNLSRFTERQNAIYWYKHGQYLHFYVGTDISAVGTWALSYNSYPQLFTDSNSLVDIQDQYVPLVIAQLKNVCLEHLGMAPSDQLNTLIDNKKKDIRENIRREKMVIDEKNAKKSVN